MTTYLKPADRRKRERELQRLEQKYDDGTAALTAARDDIAKVRQLLQDGIIDKAHASYLIEDIQTHARKVNTERHRKAKERERNERIAGSMPAAYMGVFFIFFMTLALLTTCSS